LSIRDLCFAAQPIVRSIGGAEYVIIYNGEIYNTDELTPELKKAGYRFETTTDTKVILYAYIYYGIEFVNKLNGIFAFSIWDSGLEARVPFADHRIIEYVFNVPWDVKYRGGVEKAHNFMQVPAEYGKPWFGQLMAAPQLMAYMIHVNYWLDKYSPIKTNMSVQTYQNRNIFKIFCTIE
jgi:asparagine synthetase B (glutamine-hydrolysing)